LCAHRPIRPRIRHFREPPSWQGAQTLFAHPVSAKIHGKGKGIMQVFEEVGAERDGNWGNRMGVRLL
jgi:hypothetical protein